MIRLMEVPKPNNFFKYFFLACIFILGFVLSRVTSCEHPIVIGQDTLKKEIKKETLLRDSIKDKVAKQDKERIVYLDRWHKAKHDTLFLPCDSALKQIINICDTILSKDSTEISDLKKVVSLDSLIIGNYQRIAHNDSLAIVGLNKALRKQKRRTKLVAVGMGALLGVSLFRK